MSESTPQWDIPKTDEVRPEPLPEALVNTIRDILSAYKPDRIEMVLNGVVDAIAKYRTVRAFKDNEPSLDQRSKAAEALSQDALELARKLPDCGGADVALRRLLAHSGHREEFIFDLKSSLETFASLCDQATVETPQVNNPKTVLADSLARCFAYNLEERPATTVVREYSRNHAFVQLLKAVMEHCQGRRMSDQAVEPFARAGINSGLNEWKKLFDKKSTKNRT